MIEVRKLTKYYSSHGLISAGIRNVTTTLYPKDFVAIVGESGSGKSTFLNVLGGIDTYEDGEMIAFGQETSGFNSEEWEEYRKKYNSFIFQDYNIIASYTVLENVELALLSRFHDKKERRMRAEELIERVGLTSHIKHKAARLSGGQKQRMVIARALAYDSPVILADEPTGNLDSATGDAIMKLLAEVGKDKLVIVVTHNFEQVEQYATRKLRFYDGELVEDVVLRPVDEKPCISADDTSFCGEYGENKENRDNSFVEMQNCNASSEERNEKTDDCNKSKKEKIGEKQKKASSDKPEGEKKASWWDNFRTDCWIAFRNIKSMPQKTAFTVVVMIIATLLCLGALVMEIEENTTQANNYIFRNKSENRFVIKDMYEGVIEQSRVDEIRNVEGVTGIIEYDYATDKIYYYRYGDGVDQFMRFYIYPIEAFEGTDFNVIGRLPKNQDEVFISIPAERRNDFEDMLGKNLRITLGANGFDLPEGYEPYVEGTLTGFTIINGSGDDGRFYCTEKQIHGINIASYVMDTEDVKLFVNWEGKNPTDAYAFLRFDGRLERGQYYIRRGTGGSNTVPNTVGMARIIYKNYSEDKGIPRVVEYHDVEVIMDLDLPRGYTFFYMNPYEFEEDRMPEMMTQMSVFANLADIDGVMDEIRNKGFVVVRTATAVGRDFSQDIKVYMFILIALIVFVVVYFIVRRSVMARANDYIIMRSVGITMKNVRGTITVETMVLFVASCIFTTIGVILPTMLNVQLFEMFMALTVEKILITLGSTIVISLLLGFMCSRPLFSKSIKKSLGDNKGGASL